MKEVSVASIVHQTMSSKEIADLTGKQHKNIIRDIRIMIDELDGSDLSHDLSQQYQEVKDSRGYTKEFQLDKELTTILVSGYNIPMRAKIVRRWQQLESNPLAALPHQIARYLRQNENVPIGFFIPLEIITFELTAKLSKNGIELFKDMLPEVSFVKSWNKHLTNDLGQNVKSFPTHPIKTEWDYKTHERCYPLELRLDATQHFWGEWLPVKAPKYLGERVPGARMTIPKAIPELEYKINRLGGDRDRLVFCG